MNNKLSLVLLLLSLMVFFVLFDSFEAWKNFLVMLTNVVLITILKSLLWVVLLKYSFNVKVHTYKLICYYVTIKLFLTVLEYYNYNNFVKATVFQDLTYNHIMMAIQCVICFYCCKYSFSWINKRYPEPLVKIIKQ